MTNSTKFGSWLTFETVDLRNIEDRKCSKHPDLLVLVGLLVLDVELLGEDDGRSLLAFAHLRAGLLGLLVGEPGVRGVGVYISGVPEKPVTAFIGSRPPSFPISTVCRIGRTFTSILPFDPENFKC
jgi:hypothetical protein